MFFEEGNCRALRLLHEASNFLEASLEKLLVLEKEAISELDNIKIKTEKCDPIKTGLKSNTEEIGDLKFKIAPSNDVSCNERVCTPTNENRGPKFDYLLHGRKLSTFTLEQSPPIVQETGSKRKYDTIQKNGPISDSTVLGKKAKKKKVDSKKFQHLLEQQEEIIMIKDELPLEPVENKLMLKGTISDNAHSYNEDPVEEFKVADSYNGDSGEEFKVETIHDSESITVLDEYFKVCIKFKESLPYEKVEEVMKSFGLVDVFDIVLTKKKAEVTFLNELSMKKALNLPRAARNILKASVILPVKKLAFT